MLPDSGWAGIRSKEAWVQALASFVHKEAVEPPGLSAPPCLTCG
jgi:hypothetical protein